MPWADSSANAKAPVFDLPANVELPANTYISYQGIVPRPDAFVEVLMSLAATERVPEMHEILHEFMKAMAEGGQAELAWLKGFVFAAFLSIPFPDNTSAINRSDAQLLREHIEAARGKGWDEWIKLVNEAQKDGLIMLALAAMDAGRIPAVASFSPASQQGDSPGPSSLLQAEQKPFIRLIERSSERCGLRFWCGGTSAASSLAGASAVPEGAALIQRLFDTVLMGTNADRTWLRRFAWELALTQTGSCILQNAVTAPRWLEAKKVLLESLEGNVLEACCPREENFANFALQEYMKWLPAESWQSMVVKGLRDQCKHVAKNRIGCRVLQRLIEHADQAQADVRELLDEIVGHPPALRELIADQYGNYVVQHLLEHDPLKTRQQLVVAEMCRRDSQEPHTIHAMSKHPRASNVVNKALTYCRQECTAELVDALLDVSDEEELKNLEKCKFGSFVYKDFIKILEEAYRQTELFLELHGDPQEPPYCSNKWCRLFVPDLNGIQCGLCTFNPVISTVLKNRHIDPVRLLRQNTRQDHQPTTSEPSFPGSASAAESGKGRGGRGFRGRRPKGRGRRPLPW